MRTISFRAMRNWTVTRYWRTCPFFSTATQLLLTHTSSVIWLTPNIFDFHTRWQMQLMCQARREATSMSWTNGCVSLGGAIIVWVIILVWDWINLRRCQFLGSTTRLWRGIAGCALCTKQCSKPALPSRISVRNLWYKQCCPWLKYPPYADEQYKTSYG